MAKYRVIFLFPGGAVKRSEKAQVLLAPIPRWKTCARGDAGGLLIIQEHIPHTPAGIAAEEDQVLVDILCATT